ncbi:MAG: DUF2461 domain-containing protein [Leptospiraceae bacterium]|nr:DUF2461 domain-containing protein [Leptospiraceae bacterium]MBK9498860.1 DUF2461 domain-containing protein [Leptospiraceae bacterium]MBP9162150.1 DUF2461 domain-containing protein [Leptospiraceae bacterium]
MLQKTTLDFLNDLKKNNKKDWFERNKPNFEKAKLDFEVFISELFFQLAKTNKNLIGVDPKKCIFRIYRDARFSKNKEPYKTNFGAAISETGKSMETALFYIHIEPGNNSLIAGGRYMPDSASLRKLREKILENPKEFKKILSEKKFKSLFSELSDMKVKTVPRGFSKDHPEIELLKYTSYIVEKKIDDKLLLSPDFSKLCTEAYKVLFPLLKYLNKSE